MSIGRLMLPLTKNMDWVYTRQYIRSWADPYEQNHSWRKLLGVGEVTRQLSRYGLYRPAL